MSGLTPKVTSTRVENNPLSRAQNGSGGSASTRGSSRAIRVQSVWRWCGDGVEIHRLSTWLHHRAGPDSGITAEITSMEVLTDPLQ
jgi:hypothetical protein